MRRRRRAVVAVCQYAQHDVVGHYVSVTVVMVTCRCVLVPVADWFAGVAARPRSLGDWNARRKQSLQS